MISAMLLRHRILFSSVLILAGCSILAGAAGLSALPALSTNSLPDAGNSGFAVGERLVYHVEWNPPWYLFFLPTMEAGEATLNLAEETLIQNRKTFKITFAARSSGTLVKLAGITIDDFYEFTTDADSFCTLRVTKREREGQRMRDIDLEYLPERGKLHLREVDVSKSIHRVIRDQDYDGIPPCVKDLFSALYALRRTNLEVGSSSVVVVGDNQAIRNVQIQVVKKERVSTPAGDFDAWQVNTVALMGGLFKGGGQFRMWLSADERKMPVKFEAKVSLGKVTGSLKEFHF